MWKICKLVFCLWFFFYELTLPVSAFETLSPQNQGLHVQILKLEWGPSEVNVIPPSDLIFPSMGLFLGGWSLGALTYLIYRYLFDNSEISLISSSSDFLAMSLSVLANSFFIWWVGNWGWENSGFEGDFGVTLAGVLLGQSLYIVQPELDKLDQNFVFINYLNWSFSSLGGVSAYNASLHAKN
ncbi:hypothetical protein COW36_05150 [bacterium (Candidatus Blackallbacteria) CG17_big_fil_post_rev_8_21_14_2_50_48_46]|uniref:Uncharacterized protein n=1 Tax=bacterium (Candidatus Blackallbacteria) CG17_big_fil_post_rev_8_21_14_2_50_48_46 TaxID=2014261 RepID=A0A2M7G9Y5_9BACT|nr:MAG: hypothetical protein COW64_03795 [bacterium (Candidatus Blackallbacteria) CG18_big_fil_WC_8_21_14_2_50_49_26]PIW18684.1 MAG: hypothetical protein COW36_05150 [bacterium (Candidatus Blackallbacteria) CG17_big_fil_post_rev_8_21_14_2_50_48_46]PIW46330.1 MAG: hypothetical protein COW20_15530 [bacterium (Candidatus Blackallbacteria) CG13_big_fil_rev_8_21_14_2_50_49_14]